jgi:UDP-N-acetylenolpyruvoylglucosamine reductase
LYVKRNDEHYWYREGLIEENIERIITNIGFMSSAKANKDNISAKYCVVDSLNEDTEV